MSHKQELEPSLKKTAPAPCITKPHHSGSSSSTIAGNQRNCYNKRNAKLSQILYRMLTKMKNNEKKILFRKKIQNGAHFYFFENI